jgi:hypothetical protein
MGLAGVVVRGALVWAATLGGLRVVVVQPEHCGDITAASLIASAQRAADWFRVNQRDDGTWLYRYDRATDSDVGGYNIVRHAGVTMSLEQAAAAGVDGAAETSQGGIDWTMDNLFRGPGFSALAVAGSPVKVGATGLLVAALVERRDRTDDRTYDDTLGELGAFLVTMTNERGQVYGTWDTETDAPRPDSFSPYFTGETFWALALLHRTFPDAGYDAPARRIARYLATERDDVEGWWPGVADHWAAYGFAAMTTWPDFDPAELTDAELAYVQRQMEFQSMQIRWESQRTNSFVSHYTRGRQTLGAGLGTIGEALDNWTVVAAAVPQLHDVVDEVSERARCAAGVVADRQVVDSDVPEEQGAWFQFDVTQMDDQQHAMSALLGAVPIVAVPIIEGAA